MSDREVANAEGLQGDLDGVGVVFEDEAFTGVNLWARQTTLYDRQRLQFAWPRRCVLRSGLRTFSSSSVAAGCQSDVGAVFDILGEFGGFFGQGIAHHGHLFIEAIFYPRLTESGGCDVSTGSVRHDADEKAGFVGLP